MQPVDARAISIAPTQPNARGILALTLLSVLTFAAGLALIIGYNWESIPPTVRVASLIAAVFVAFALSAAADAKAYALPADLLAILGVTLHGASIWLIATVLEMEGYFPDTLQWWSLGAVASALLLRRFMVSIAAAVALAAWALAMLGNGRMPDEGRTVWFAAAWVGSLIAAYGTPSPTTIRILIAAAALWAPLLAPEWVGWAMIFGLNAGVGCIAYAIGKCHADTNATLRRAWQTSGLAIVLFAFLPLLFAEPHQGHFYERMTVPFACAGLLAVASIVAVTWWKRPTTLLDAVVVVTVVTIATWMGLLATGFSGANDWPRTCASVFSVLAVAFAIALIQQALTSDRVGDLLLGLAFAVSFLVIRWLSVLDSMLWSGVMLIVASGGFLFVARAWRGRRVVAVPGGNR